MNRNRELGAWGEEQAARYLKRKGYTIVDRNFRCRQGELDLVARRGEILAFVEVKLRRNADFAEAREFVGYAKQRRILKAAALWLSVHGCELQPRFDVIEIYAPEGEKSRFLRINHLEDAFC